MLAAPRASQFHGDGGDIKKSSVTDRKDSEKACRSVIKSGCLPTSPKESQRAYRLVKIYFWFVSRVGTCSYSG